MKSNLVWNESKKSIKTEVERQSKEKNQHLRWSSQESNTFYYTSQLFIDPPQSPVRESFYKEITNHDILKRSFNQTKTNFEHRTGMASLILSPKSGSSLNLPHISNLSSRRKFKSVSTIKTNRLSGYAMSTNVASPCDSVKQSIEIRAN